MLNLHNLKLNTKDQFGFAIQQNLGFKSWISANHILHNKFAKFMHSHFIKLQDLQETLSIFACCKYEKPKPTKHLPNCAQHVVHNLQKLQSSFVANKMAMKLYEKGLTSHPSRLIYLLE